MIYEIIIALHRSPVLYVVHRYLQSSSNASRRVIFDALLHFGERRLKVNIPLLRASLAIVSTIFLSLFYTHISHEMASSQQPLTKAPLDSNHHATGTSNTTAEEPRTCIICSKEYTDTTYKKMCFKCVSKGSVLLRFARELPLSKTTRKKNDDGRAATNDSNRSEGEPHDLIHDAAVQRLKTIQGEDETTREYIPVMDTSITALPMERCVD